MHGSESGSGCRQNNEQGPLQKPAMDEEERDPRGPPA